MYPFRNQPVVPESLKDTVLFNKQEQSTPAYDPRETGEFVETKYDTNIDYVANRDYQDIRAARQGNTEALGNILGRNLGKLGLRALDGASFLLTAPINLIKEAVTGEVNTVGDAFSAVVDNPVSSWLRDQESWLDQQLPLYQTKEQDRSIDMTSMGFADKLLNGLAYVGSMATGTPAAGAIAKNIAKLTKYAGGSKNLGKLFATAAEEGKDLNYITNLFKDSAVLTEELARIKKLGGSKVKDDITNFYAGAIESAAEASGSKEEVVKNLTDRALKENNGQPLSAEQLEAIQQEGNKALMLNFGTNLLVTGATNKLIYSKMLNNKWSDDMVAYNKITKSGDQYVMQEAALKTDKYSKLFKPIKSVLQSQVAKGAIEEGKQEGIQFVSNDFFVNLYSQPDGESVGKVKDTFSSIFEAGSETVDRLGSKDAMESMLLGALIGGGMGGYINRNKDKETRENTQNLVNKANNYSTSNALKELAKSVKLSDAADGAVINGDRVTYETLKAAQIFDLVNSRDNIGKFSDLKQELREAKEKSLPQFIEEYDIKDPDFTESKRDKFVDYISNLADKTKDAKTRLMNNYGHKLTQLEVENPDITGFLTMIDVLKEDYIQRENDLFTKLSPYMKYDEMIANRLTPERLESFQKEIIKLNEQATAIQNESANTADALTDRNSRLKEVFNKINTMQNSIANSATEATYKEFLQISNLDEEKTLKKVTEKTRYAEYTKDLNDFKHIQKAKEQLIDYYSKVVNDVDYTKQVQEQINLANHSALLEDIFSVNVNINQTPRKDANGANITRKDGSIVEDHFFTNPESGTKGKVQDYIKTGDIYLLGEKQLKAGTNQVLDTSAPVEITDTQIEVRNGVPVGTITFKDQRGKTRTMTSNQFKGAIKPFVGTNLQLKHKFDQEAENVKLYRLYKDRAIQFEFNGKQVVGMLGFSPSSYNAEDLVLKYKDEDGKWKSTLFKAAQFEGSIKRGYTKILSERETLAFQLNSNAKEYATSLLKGIEINNKALNTVTKQLQKLESKAKVATLNNNNKENNAINNAVKSYEKFADKLQNQIDIKQATIDRLNKIESINLETSEELDNDFNKIITDLLEYTNSARNLAQNKDANGKTPKQIKSEKIKRAGEIEIDGKKTTRSIINKEVARLKQSFVDKVLNELTPEQQATITNPDLNSNLDLQYIDALKFAEEADTNTPLSDILLSEQEINKAQQLLNDVSETITDQVAQIEQEYMAQILESTNLNPNEIELLRTAELAAIMKLIKFINERGFYPDNRKFNRTVQETEYVLPEPGQEISFVTQRSSFRIKTTGNSENTDSLTKKEFYRNIHKLSPEKNKVRVAKPEEYPNLGLTGGENDIFLVVTDLQGNDIVENTNKLVTTLPLNTLTDTFGFRFREFEGENGVSPLRKEIGNKFDAVLQSNPDNVYESISNITDQLLKDYPTETQFINELKSQVEDLERLRETILNNRSNNILLSLKGKSNGIPRTSSTSQTSDAAFTPDGNIVVADSDIYESVGNSYNVTSGRAYFEDASTSTFFPVTVDRIGNKNVFINGKNTGISFVDNIINAGKFLQASVTDKATNTSNQIVDSKKAHEIVNNHLSYYTYTNKNVDKPDSIFEYRIEEDEVIFYIGATTGLKLSTDEAQIRALLANKIFNIDRKSLDKESIRFEFFKPKENGYTIDNYQNVNYQQFIKSNFGIKTNIIPNKDGSLYKNGYLVLDNNPNIETAPSVDSTVTANPFSAPQQKNANPLSSLVSKLASTTTPSTSNPFGTESSTPSTSNPFAQSAPAAKTNPFAANPEVNSDGTVSASSILGINPTRTTRRKLTESFYRGNVDNIMSPKQFEAAKKRFSKYGVDLEIVKGLIDNDAFGLVAEAAETLLSDRAPKGTDYHEEFHLVSQHILSNEELNDLYSEWRDKNDSTASDDVVEENLAEDFRLVRQGYEGFTGKIKAIFDRLWNRIKTIVGLGNNLQQIYSDIYFGKYYGKPIYKATKPYKSSITEIPYEVRQKAFRGATKQLVGDLINSFGKNILFTESEELSIDEQIEAVNLLTTDKDARLDYINYVEDNGASFLNELIFDSLKNYFNNVQDLTTAQVGEYLNRTGNTKDFINEYTAFVSKELNLSTLEGENIDEDTTGKDIVKKGDNEINFFDEGVSQIKLLAYTQADNSGVYPINPATLTKIYIDNLVDSKNSKDFEEKLKTLDRNPNVTNNFDPAYVNAIRNINQITGINNPNRTKAQQFMVGNLWSSFGKISTGFKILKVSDEETTGMFDLDYYWVDASKEASVSNSKRDILNNIKDNYSNAKSLIQASDKKTSKGETIVANPDQVFEALFQIPAKKYKEYKPNTIQNIINSVARTSSLEEYLKSKINNDVNGIAEYVSSQNVEKVFSFFNAGNKLQHSLQNPSSLFYRMRDVAKTSNILNMDGIVSLNGIQKSLSKDITNRTSNELTETDLHIIFFNGLVPKNKLNSKSIIPFVFSGDKSTLTGIEVTLKENISFAGSLKTDSVNGDTIDHTFAYEQYLKDELEDLNKIIGLNNKELKIGKNKIKEDLPFFSFLNKKNPTLYKSIINDVKNLSKNNDSLENILSRYKEEVFGETQKHFREKAIELDKLFKKIGFDYSSVYLKNGTGLSEANDITMLHWYASTYAIGVQEQTKLVGSLNFYDEVAKRIPAWNGAKRPLRTDPDWVNWYNNQYKSNINVGELRSLVIEDIDTQQDIIDEGVYSDNNPADAQAYISLDAARFMLFSSGTYSFRLDDLFRELESLDKKSKLTAKDMESLDNMVEELNEYMNVLKPQYYGMQTIDNVEIPTFYKFSVLPLSKALTQNRNLENIRNKMTENGIHIVMFDSANKVGRKIGKNLNLYDKQGNFIFNEVSRDDIQDAIQVSPWEGLGIQVDMPKAHETVTFGTQMRKLISVDLTGNYVIREQDYSPEQVRKKIDDLIIEKLETDKKQLMNKLGLTEDLVVTPDKINSVKKQLIRQAISRDFSNQFIDSLRKLNSYDFLNNKSKIQQLINSIVSKGVIKQTMNGDAKAMVSSALFEKENGGVQHDKRLKFYKKGVRSYMEVLLPNNLKERYSQFIEYNETENLYSFKRGTPDEITKLIGYRIPTQSPVSIENIKIKGFLPASYGNAIVVPFEITSKAGSDFDIDKLNLFMPKFNYSISDSEISKLLDKLPDEMFQGAQLSRLDYYKVIQETLAEDLEASDYTILKYIKNNAKGKYSYAKNHVDNRIIEFFTDLMGSANYFDNFVNTIDSGDFKALAKQIGASRGLAKSKEDEKASSNFYDPIYTAMRRSSFMNAKDTLGAIAVSTTHHAESQKHKLAINSSTIQNGKQARVVVEKGTATLGELLRIFQPNIEENGKIRLDRIFNFENKKISDILSQLLNASVDAAKDDYITSANLDLETVGVATLMVRSGIPINKIFNFLSQPGIVEYTEALRKTKVAALPAISRNIVSDRFNGGNYLSLDFNSISELKNNISPNYTANQEQLNLIDLYKNIEEYARLLTDLQQITNFDTKATGSMLEENEINIFKYNDFTKRHSTMFSGLDTMLNTEVSFTARMRQEAQMANNFNNSLFKLGEFYTPTDENPTGLIPNIKHVLDEIFSAKSKGADKANKAFKFKNYFNSYLLQRIALGNNKEFNSIVPKTIAQIKDINVQNAFLRRLRTGDNKIFMHGGASINSDEANLLGESFSELYTNPATKEVAQNIILSGLYQFGLVNNPSTIMNVIPTTLMLDTLRITSDNPIVEAYQKVIQLDGTLGKAVNNAKDHANAAKGSNHFSNNVLYAPQKNYTSYNTNKDLDNENPNDC